MQDIIKEIITLKIGKVLINEKISNYTTYRVGGKVRAVIYPKTIDDLQKLVKLLNERHVKYFVLGNGSNVLFSDKLYEGIIIKLDYFNKLVIDDKGVVTVGAGYSLVKLANETVKRSLQGLEFANGIPGTVGGAVFMNAGCYSSDMSSVVKLVKIVTESGKIITLTNEEMKFSYRTSYLQKHLNYVCFETVLELKKGRYEELNQLLIERREKRKATQPLNYPSAGSVFRNPDGLYAGKLIEDLGLKGFSIGKAEISEKHANFIINKGNAKASDIKSIIDMVKEKVLKKYNMALRVEQRLINWGDKNEEEGKTKKSS